MDVFSTETHIATIDEQFTKEKSKCVKYILLKYKCFLVVVFAIVCMAELSVVLISNTEASEKIRALYSYINQKRNQTRG